MFARGILTLAFLSVAGAVAAEPAKWVFAMNRFSDDAEVAYVSNVVARAKAAGLNGLCLLSGGGYTSFSLGADRDEPTADYIGNACGLESWDKWDPKRKDRFNAIRAYCESIGFDIVPLLWSPGYFSMRYENPNWVAAFPVKDVPCVARNGRVTCAGRARDFRVDTDGEWRDGVLTLDIDKLHARTPSSASGRIRLKVRPYTRYRISLKFATRGFTGTDYEPSWPTISVDVGDGVCAGGVARRKMARDQDWTEHSKELNTLHHTNITVGIGSFTKYPHGTLLVKDIAVEECGIDQPVKREGCPFVVRDAETGKIYEEGRDYANVPYLKALAWPAKGEPISFDVVKGGAIREGTQLLVSAYEPPRSMRRQFSVCPSVPELSAFMTKAAENVMSATGSKRWLLSLDEIRNECLCERCERRHEDIAHKMGRHITELVDTIHARYPAVDLYAWCDMLNPYDNPRQKHYYNCVTTWQGVWDLIPGPDKLKIAYWGSKPRQKEIDFFVQRGYRGIACGYYDYDPELKDPAKWTDVMNAHPGAFDGWMYTTWEQNHHQIADFAKKMDAGWKMKKPAKWVFWNQHIDTPAQLEKFTNMLSQASALGFEKVLLGSGEDYASCWRSEWKSTYLEAVKAIRREGLGVCVALWSLGYGAMLNYGVDLVEGAPIKDVTFKVDAAGTHAAFVPEPPEKPFAPNGGFERYDGKRGFPDFTFIDGDRGPNVYTVQDRAVKHGGEASLRCELGKGSTRVSLSVLPKPNRHYKFSAWLKWEGFDPKKRPLQLLVQRDGGKKGKISLVAKRVRPAAASDWVKVETEFNSIEFGPLRLWVGVWDNAQTGRFWVDDFQLEEVAPRCLVHNVGAPVIVQRKRDGALLREGADFSFPFLDYAALKNQKPPYPPVTMTILNRKVVKPGEELLVTYYAPSNSGDGNDVQPSICPSNPALYPILAASARQVQELLAPDEWLISFDEWRNGNACAACQARRTTLPAMIADCAVKCRDIIREINPAAPVHIWSDMFCPDENARENYYAVRGRCDDGMNYLPASFNIACWGGASKAKASMGRFERAGHRTLAAAFYDEDASFAGTKLWLEAMVENHRESAICYTTWNRDYSKMAAWSAFVDRFCDERGLTAGTRERTVDFGDQGVGGYPEITVGGVTSPAKIRVEYATHPDGLTGKGDFQHETRATYMGEQLWLPILPANTDRFDVFEVVSNGTYRAPLAQGLVRYARWTVESGAAEVTGVRFVNDGIHGEEPVVGSFDCDDERLNALWKASVRTCQLSAIPGRDRPLAVAGVHTSAVLGVSHPYLSDGAKRDRLVWSGDLWWAQRNMYVAFAPESPYMPGSLRLLAENRTSDGYVQACPFPESHGPLAAGDYGPFASDEFAAWFVPVLADHVLHTGDLKLAAEMKPVAEALVAYLVRHSGADFVFEQRPETSKHSCGLAVGGTSCHHRSYMNILLWKTYRDAAALARWTGDAAAAAAHETRAAKLAAAIRAKFWNAARGTFVLSLEESEKDGVEANALALAVTFATAAETKAILPKLQRHWHGKFQFLAVRGAFAYGEGKKAMELIAAHNWLKVVAPEWRGLKLTSECMYLVKKGWPDEAHSDTALAGVLTNYLLGVEPLEPGYRTFKVVPRPVPGVTRAKGRVPVPGGFIDVSWRLIDGKPDVVVSAPPACRQVADGQR